MKEMFIKRPIVSLLLGCCAIKGIVTIAKIVGYAITGKQEILVVGGGTLTTTTNVDDDSTVEVEVEGDDEDDQSGDIQ